MQKRILKTSRLVLREMSQDDLDFVAKMLRRIIETWLAASFEGGRHARRLEKIARLEDKNVKNRVN